MILKAIEMQGFKSFPEKTVLHFNRGITAVVGPNGSGKSNIADAVRWVLGEQSTKSLRSSKMEDVIFDGTKVRKAHTFAQVTLYLDNTDRTISEVDEDEITVTRRFFRSGESEYKVNGKNVLLRELHAEERSAILLVTHDPVVAAAADRVHFLKDGAIALSFDTGHDAAEISRRYLETWGPAGGDAR